MSQYTEEHFDEDHQDAYLESVHLDFAAQESAEIRRNCWDGDQAEDGYSLDYAYDAFNAGLTASDYAKKVAETKARVLES